MGNSQSQKFQQNEDENNNIIKPQYQGSDAQPKKKTASSELGDAKGMEKEEITQFPHNYQAILSHTDLPIEYYTTDDLVSEFRSGMFLNQKRKKYWWDTKSNKNCFMLFARDLSITWAEDYRYWRWFNLKETNSAEFIEIAELLQVCWLEVHGKFDVALLSPGTLYEVVFIIMLREKAFGWEVPVNFRLTLPNGDKVERKEILMAKPKEQWVEIPIGEFTTSSVSAGELDIYFHEYAGGTWKRGLMIKGVAIRPKN